MGKKNGHLIRKYSFLFSLRESEDMERTKITIAR